MDGQLRVPKRNHHQGSRYFWGVIQIVDEAIIIISRYVLRHTAFSLIHVDRLGYVSQPASYAREGESPTRIKGLPHKRRAGPGGRRGSGRVWGKVDGGEKFLDLRKGVAPPAPFWKTMEACISPLVVLAAQCGIAPLPRVSHFPIPTYVVEPLLPQFKS